MAVRYSVNVDLLLTHLRLALGTGGCETGRGAGAIAPGKRIGTHTLRHSYARHLLMNGIPINYLSRWLGHSSIQTTLIYLELVPDPSGSLLMVP